MPRPTHRNHQSDSRTTASERSHRSDASYRSGSTTSTEYSDPQHDYNNREPDFYYEEKSQGYPQERWREIVQGREEEDEDSFHGTPTTYHAVSPPTAIPSTPKDFGSLFPSTRTLTIQHDDFTMDGNENLRIDTEVAVGEGKKAMVTLFHLRMHDLNTREFSLRRYHRNSGNELCKSSRKYDGETLERPGFPSVLTGALRSITNSRPSTPSGLSRTDSGYASVQDTSFEGSELDISRPKQGTPTNTINMISHNYDHFKVTRSSWRDSYRFKHWDNTYTWRIHTEATGGVESVSYHLHKNNSRKELARIWPKLLARDEREKEAHRGGLVPFCYFKILDESLLRNEAEITDYVISSALMSLVDDCIRRRSGPPKTTIEIGMWNPFSKTGYWKAELEPVGPKQLVNHLMRRSTG